MSKYNLIDIYEGMSDEEFSAAEEAGRLEKHPEKDKIQKIKDLMSKENNIEEMTGEIYNRIDSLIDQNLKMEFIDKFIAIQDDLIEAGDEFDKMDLIDYLASELQKFGARNFEEGKNKLMKEEEMISKDRYDKLLDGAASRYEELENQFIKFIQDNYDKDFDMEDFKDFQGGMSDEASIEESNKAKPMNLREEIGPTGIAISQNQLDNLKKFGAIPGLEVMVQDKDGSNVRKVDYTLTNTDFEKGDDDYDYLEEGLKEHFGRFMKDYQ